MTGPPIESGREDWLDDPAATGSATPPGTVLRPVAMGGCGGMSDTKKNDPAEPIDPDDLEIGRAHV